MLDQLLVKRHGRPGHLSDITVEVVNLAVIRNEDDFHLVLQVFVTFDDAVELVTQIFRIETTGRSPVGAVVEPDVLALAGELAVPLSSGHVRIVRLLELVSEELDNTLGGFHI